jgi:glucose-1-phosphate cytidylyltransferase
MKVVLFCGGQGMRLREASEQLPKPMVHIGYRPVLWHVMRYYAHFGHTDFILCLGYKADVIKNYFLKYDECLSNDFVISRGGQQVKLLSRDIDDWNITLADTGMHSNIGQRLMAVREHLNGEEMFLANYSDGLTDVDLDSYVETFAATGKTAATLCVQPTQSFHLMSIDNDSEVTSIDHISNSGHWINGGYFIFRNSIFDSMQPGEELVEGPFRRLIEQREVFGYRYQGFWQAMDTLKDKQQLDERFASGNAPWQVWDGDRGTATPVGGSA